MGVFVLHDQERRREKLVEVLREVRVREGEVMDDFKIGDRVYWVDTCYAKDRHGNYNGDCVEVRVSEGTVIATDCESLTLQVKGWFWNSLEIIKKSRAAKTRGEICLFRIKNNEPILVRSRERF